MGLGTFGATNCKTPTWALAFILLSGLSLPLRFAPAQTALPATPQIGTPVPKAKSSAFSPGAKLTLRVYNYAQLDSTSLAASEKVAGGILQSVGVETIWMDCPAYKPSSRTKPAEDIKYSACDSEMGTTDLVLRILPRNMAVKLRRSYDSLGSAQTCPETEPACELNVFYHRVDELGAKGYRSDRILGYVIAHEAAHVLLGPRHSDDGILRSEWSSTELQRISLGMELNFTTDQSRQLRLAVLRRVMPPIEQATTRANPIFQPMQ